MAAAIGKQADADKYGALADDIAAAFNAAYLDKKTNNYPGATQTADLLPLAFGIVPDDRRAAVAENIAKDATARDYHLSTGFLGTPQILPMLTESGWQDVACRVATQRTYPSWGYMVDKGATTIWELWNSDTEGPGMNSRNHFALGSVGEWYYEALAGLSTDPRARLQAPSREARTVRRCDVGRRRLPLDVRPRAQRLEDREGRLRPQAHRPGQHDGGGLDPDGPGHEGPRGRHPHREIARREAHRPHAHTLRRRRRRHPPGRRL
jgi:hypothetical protein